MKDRDISILDFFYALQREFICLEIRSKIYISKNDKEYFGKLMAKKKTAILTLSKKNNLPNIFESDDEDLRVWKEIVPLFGFPKLIYNIVNVTPEKLSFPYANTVVKCGDSFGITQKVNFEDNTVSVILSGDAFISVFHKNEVKRLNHEQTDEYFYYIAGNSFNTKENGIGVLKEYSMKDKKAVIFFSEERVLTLDRDQIARIL